MSSLLITSTYEWVWADASVRFTANVTDVSIYSYSFLGQHSVRLYQDEIAVGTIITANGVPGFYTIASGLSGTHSYQIDVVPAASSGGLDIAINSVVLAGGTGLSSVVTPARDTWAWYGDSIVLDDTPCSHAGAAGYRDVDAWGVAHANHRGEVRAGNGGQKVSTFLRDHTSQVTSLSPKPKMVLVEGGVNDCILGTPIGNAVTAGTFTGDFVTMLNNLNSGLTAGTRLFVRQLLPTATSCSAYVTAQSVAVDAYMAGIPSSPAYLISGVSSWLSLADLCSDPHPGPTGYQKITGKEVPYTANMMGFHPIRVQ